MVIVCKLVLLRHGTSLFNSSHQFTGWIDCKLADEGRQQAALAGQQLRTEGLGFDRVYSSVLSRARETAQLVVSATGFPGVVETTWRLNERSYGSLEGRSKEECVAEFGWRQVQEWRRSYGSRPPSLSLNSPLHPRNDPNYADVPPELLPSAESLRDVAGRVAPFLHGTIMARIEAGENVLVVAHCNTIRAIRKIVDGISNLAIVDLDVPTGLPYVMTFDGRIFASGRYLAAEAAVATALRAAQAYGS